MDIWLKIFSSAASLAVLAYLIRFFGNIVADTKPFFDDRRWGAEFSGVLFFLNIIAFPGIVGGIIALYVGGLPASIWTQLFYFLLISICGVFFWGSFALARKVYDVELQPAKPEQKDYLEFLDKFCIKITKYTWWPSIILGYVLTREYLTQSTTWLLIFTIEAFVSLVFQAIVYSMVTIKELPEVDIFIVGGKSVIRDAKLLKYNDSNVRLRIGNQIMILEKNQIAKIVFKKEVNSIKADISPK